MSGATPAKAASTGLMAFLAAATMLFAALTSAYIVRRGLAGDWTPVPLPWVVPAGVLVMMAGSFVLEIGWFRGVVGLGLLFVLMQAYGLHEVSRSGISITASPSAAFVCVLVGIFVVFVIGAAAAIVAAARRRLVAVYWHYLTAVWIYFMILLYLRR
jgi:cytochrome c oxidase subunit 3